MSDEDPVKKNMDNSNKEDYSKNNKNSSTGKQEESGLIEPKLFKPGSLRKKEKSSQKDTLFVKEKKDEIIFTPSKGEKNIHGENPSANENNEEQRILSSEESDVSDSKEDLPNVFTPHPKNETNDKNIEKIQEKTTEAIGTEDLNENDMPKTSLSQAPTANDDTENLLSDETEEEDKESDSETDSQTKIKTSFKNINFVQKIRNLLEREMEPIEQYDPAIHGPITYFEGIANYEEIERYWLDEPFCFVVILYNELLNDYLYQIVEPKLDEFEEIFLTEIKDRLRDVLLVENIDRLADKEKILEEKILIILKDYAIKFTPLMLGKIIYYVKRDFVRLGKIDPLMYDDGIEDISGNGHDKPVFLYHKKYSNISTNIYFEEDELNSFIIQLAQKSGKHISVAEPMIDATMPDGSRIQMTLGTTVTTHGSTFTIRKFSETPITPIDLLEWGTFSSAGMAYLWLCIENNKSLIYAGGTASGKTSSLNAVSLFIPEKAKIISLEDTRELKLPHINWIPGVTRDSFTADERGAVDMYDLLKAALRQRPEYLLVGEVRGKEALTLFQAMSTGHTTFSTMHADSVSSAIHRLENPPISVPRNMIQALDIMSIQAQTFSAGKRVRRNLKLVEITDIDPNTRNIRTNDIFTWDSSTDSFRHTGKSKALNDIKLQRGWNEGDIKRELQTRQNILEYMLYNGIRDFKEIATIIKEYQATPEKTLARFGMDK
jgi:flagellar protein FlaI